MKHTTFTAAVLTLLAAAPAAWGEGYYVQGDFGLANLRAEAKGLGNLKTSYRESGALPRLSGGYDFGGFRVAGDYTHYQKASAASGAGSSSTRTQGVGVSAIYDIPVGLAVQPYVGARIALNNVKQEAQGSGFFSKTSETKFSPGVMAGVGYALDRNVNLDAGYRYNHFDKKLKAHEATVGVRYTFH